MAPPPLPMIGFDEDDFASFDEEDDEETGGYPGSIDYGEEI